MFDSIKKVFGGAGADYFILLTGACPPFGILNTEKNRGLSKVDVLAIDPRVIYLKKRQRTSN